MRGLYFFSLAASWRRFRRPPGKRGRNGRSFLEDIPTGPGRPNMERAGAAVIKSLCNPAARADSAGRPPAMPGGANPWAGDAPRGGDARAAHRKHLVIDTDIL